MSAPATISLAEAEQGTSLWQDAWRRLRRNRLAVCGLFVLVFFIAIALLTPWIAPYGYARAEPGTRRHAALNVRTGWARTILGATC